jgi:hypothetical protein
MTKREIYGIGRIENIITNILDKKQPAFPHSEKNWLFFHTSL